MPLHIVPRLHHHTSCCHCLSCLHCATTHHASTAPPRFVLPPPRCLLSCRRHTRVTIALLGVMPLQSCRGCRAAGCPAIAVVPWPSHCCPLHRGALLRVVSSQLLPPVAPPRGRTMRRRCVWSRHRTAACPAAAIALLCVLPWPSHCRPLHHGLLCHGALLRVVSSQLLPPPHGRATGRCCVHVAGTPLPIVPRPCCKQNLKRETKKKEKGQLTVADGVQLLRVLLQCAAARCVAIALLLVMPWPC